MWKMEEMGLNLLNLRKPVSPQREQMMKTTPLYRLLVEIGLLRTTRLKLVCGSREQNSTRGEVSTDSHVTRLSVPFEV